MNVNLKCLQPCVFCLETEDCMYTFSQCVTTCPLSHPKGAMSQSPTPAQMPQNKNSHLNSNLVYPFSLHDIQQGIQTIQPLGSKDETNESQQNASPLLGEDVTEVHPRRTVLRTVDARPCAQRTSLTRARRIGLVHSSPYRSNSASSQQSTRCASAVRLRQIIRVTPNWCS